MTARDGESVAPPGVGLTENVAVLSPPPASSARKRIARPTTHTTRANTTEAVPTKRIAPASSPMTWF
mgnify:CR=1 FL=1